MTRSPAKLHVHIYDNCEVDCQAVNVSKQAGDEIEWHSANEAFTVQFESSPFKDDTFPVPAGGSIGSGPIKDNASEDTYHYAVRSANLAMSADPDVNVKK